MTRISFLTVSELFAKECFYAVGQSRVVQNVAQLRGREAAREFEGAGQRSFLVAKQCHANFGPHRPFRMAADGLDQSGGGVGPLQRFHDCGLREAGIFQRSLPDARFFIEQQGCRDRFRAAACESNALAQSDGFDAGDEQVSGGALQVGGDGGQQSELHEIESIEFAYEAQRDAARRARMSGKSEADFAGFDQAGVLAECDDGFGGEVGHLQNGEGTIFGERGI